MDYTLNDEQKQIVEAARKFARNEFPKVALQCDREEKFPKEVWQKAGELGFMGIFITPEYGGLGMGCLEHAMVMEEFWRVDPGVGNILLAVFGAEILGAFGTEKQKQNYLVPIAEGKAIMGCAITEPNSGSDIFGIRTRASSTSGRLPHQWLQAVHHQREHCRFRPRLLPYQPGSRQADPTFQLPDS